MLDINDVADYIILKLKSDEEAPLINLKLQKLLYYVQAWSYGIHKKSIFKGDFQAWVHGPVNTDIFNRFAPTKILYSEIELDDVLNKDVLTKIQGEDAEHIDYILENYAKFSGVQLESISHSEQPWVETRGNIALAERCTNVINPELMKSYYGKKWEEINE